MIDINYGLPCRESNYRKENSGRDFIVLHYYGNDNTTAWQNAHYFHESKVEASAHYFIDNDSCYASVPEEDTAWSVSVKYGDAPLWGICKNSNSINIELATFNGEIQAPTVNKAVELTKHLMNKYGIPLENVVRHYDVCHKDCPAPWVGEGQGDLLWNIFKMMVAGFNGDVETPAPVVEPSPIGQSVIQADRELKRAGQDNANNFVCHDCIVPDGAVGGETCRMAIRVLQHAMNLDYYEGYVNHSLEVRLAEDGLWGEKTESALEGHYVEKGESQYMVTAAEIFALLLGNNPNGVEKPGIYGDGLASCYNTERIDSNGFKWILGIMGCDMSYH